MTWFIGFIVILVGVFMVVKTQWIYEFTGPIEFAERYLGTEGGTMLFLKLLGIAAIILAFLGMTGILGGWVIRFFGPALS